MLLLWPLVLRLLLFGAREEGRGYGACSSFRVPLLLIVLALPLDRRRGVNSIPRRTLLKIDDGVPPGRATPLLIGHPSDRAKSLILSQLRDV